MSLITSHQFITGAAQNMQSIADESVALVVTSPPYPMIEMWDDIFSAQNPAVSDCLKQGKANEAFELMHQALDEVWREVNRVLMPGGFACINIGDATRTIGGYFALYPNHARIITAFRRLGMHCLPAVLWRKQTNAPNKFMGAGMLPAGAYVTLEHEWILIFRKGGKRRFNTAEAKAKRKESAFFWEERNIWFSDLWDFKGVKQTLSIGTRERSAAFPLELPYRLINMYSLYGDTVLDPFAGTGTTLLAAMASGRNSIGYEIDPAFAHWFCQQIRTLSLKQINALVEERIRRHQIFVDNRRAERKALKYVNTHLGVPVMTMQEQEIRFYLAQSIEEKENAFQLIYKEYQADKKQQTVSDDIQLSVSEQMSLF